MKRYIKSHSYRLQPITVQSGWLYRPYDKGSIIYQNPIQYVGDEKANEVVDAYHSFNYECIAEDVENVDLNTLKSVQAFVTDTGLNKDIKDSEEVFAVRLDNQIYLMNGNHRVVKAYLQGKRYYPMIVRTLVETKW